MRNYDYGPWFPEQWYATTCPPRRGFKSAVHEEWSIEDIARLTPDDVTNEHCDSTRIYGPALATHQNLTTEDFTRLGIKKFSHISNWHFARNTDKYEKIKKSGAFRQFKCINSSGEDLTKKIDREVRWDNTDPKKRKPIPESEVVDYDDIRIIVYLGAWKKPVLSLGEYKVWADHSQYRIPYPFVWGMPLTYEGNVLPMKSESQIVKALVDINDLAFIDKDYPIRSPKILITEIIYDTYKEMK